MLSRRHFVIASALGLSSPALVQARSARLETVRQTALGLEQLHAILVQQGETILLSEAPRGPGLNRMANIKSCSKSLLALILGSALARGDVPSLGARLGDLAPGLIPQDATEGVADLTLEDLVTLRAGLGSTSGPNYGAWVSTRNWVAYALRQPRISGNGQQMIYSTGTSHVLGAVLTTVTGKTLLQLARERLGAGLGIEIPAWTRDPQGFYFGGNEMALTPQAMLRVATLMRDGGQQILDADWIAASHEARTRSPFSGLGYGYGWFISPGGWTLARGYGGQIIAAHPERALAVAITSDPTRPARSQGHFGDLLALLEGPVLALG